MAIKLTKANVESLPIPVSLIPGKIAQQRHYDDTVKGFGVRVTSGKTKAFFVEKRINGKLHRITLGRVGVMTAENARKKALTFLGQIASGIDPLAEKRTAKVKAASLRKVFEDYIKARKSIKPQTISNYRGVLNTAFNDWLDKPFTSITKDQIVTRHALVGGRSGHARANLAMRVLRALFNFAAAQYEDAQGKSLITENPTKRLSQTRSWYRIKRRETYIKPHELASWYQAVQEIENTTLRDYFLLVLFTGLRREEAASLRWSQVDLKGGQLKIVDTKNSETHTLPLSSYLHKLLSERRATVTGDFVFPGPGVNGYIVEMRKQMARIIEKSGVEFAIHDLRRTFITVAESLDISAYALKRLLNHKMNNDVTSGYIIMDVERLRKPMQQVTDYLLKLVKNRDYLDCMQEVSNVQGV